MYYVLYMYMCFARLLYYNVITPEKDFLVNLLY